MEQQRQTTNNAGGPPRPAGHSTPTSAYAIMESARLASIDAAKARVRLAAIGGEEDGALPADVGEGFIAAQLQRRIKADEQAIDRGCAIIAMLEPVLPWWVIDAMSLRYLECMTWVKVADTVCYSARHVQQVVSDALALADRMGGATA